MNIDGLTQSLRVQINKLNHTRQVRRVIPPVEPDDTEFRQFIDKVKLDTDLPIVKINVQTDLDTIPKQKPKSIKAKRFKSQSV